MGRTGVEDGRGRKYAPLLHNLHTWHELCMGGNAARFYLFVRPSRRLVNVRFRKKNGVGNPGLKGK